jgi:uncharacterized repeat protein (TIGR01451 family)
MLKLTRNRARSAYWLAGFIIALCLGAPALAGTWTQLGTLNTPRDNASVALLPDGLVLVAGGANAGGTLSSAELYDPASGTFSVTGSLATARQNATATMLTNGTVLIAGGTNSAGALATAEIYNPASESFSETGSMAAARSSATATLLVDGGVLVAGGADGTTAIADAELYDAASGEFTPTGSLQTARSSATATLLTDGRVLIAGGIALGTNSASLASTEIYDPSVGMFDSGAMLAAARESAIATLLPSGKVLIAGGYSVAEEVVHALNRAELYDPVVGTSTATGSMANARFGAIAALLPSGDVLIAGGASGNGFLQNSTSIASAEIYSTTLGAFSSAGSMTAARESASAVLLPNSQVLVIGGVNNGSDLKRAAYPALAESYDASTASFVATGSMSVPCSTPLSVALPNGKVFVRGCDPIAFQETPQVFDPTAGSFTALPVQEIVRGFGTLSLLGNGKALCVGGNEAPILFADMYDPVTGSIQLVGPLVVDRTDHTATILADGKVLLAGGLKVGAAVAVSSTELYDPVAGTFTASGSMLSTRGKATATLLANGKVLIAGGDPLLNDHPTAESELFDPQTGTFSVTGSLITARYSANAVLLPNGKVLIAGGLGTSDTPIDSAELYDPVTGTFSGTGGFTTAARSATTATLLANGKVLFTGGNDGGRNTPTSSTLASAEIYDPATGLFSAAGTMTTIRQSAAATLLPSGKVLIVGGLFLNADNSQTPLASAELYDPGLAVSDARRPQIDEIAVVEGQPLRLSLSGSGLRASTEQATGALVGSEASSGSAQSAATNYPLLQLRRVDNDQEFFLSPDPTQPWTDTQFVASAASGLPLGFYRATVFVNGIPSQSYLFPVTSGYKISLSGGDQQSAIVHTQFAQPLQMIVTDNDNNPVEGVGVTVNFTCTPASSGACIIALNPVDTDLKGLVSIPVVANSALGSYTVQASVSGSPPVTFHLTNRPGPAAILSTTGTPQSTQVNTAFASMLQITVTDAFNNPLPGTVVTFSDPANGASAGLSKSLVTTDSNGAATITATANKVAGSYVVTASVGALSTQFSLTNTSGPAATMTALDGPTFTGTAGLALAISPAVAVTDGFGNPITGVPVTFATGDNSGSITDENPLTDGTGIATAGNWTLAADPGTNTLQASAAGLTGSPVQFSAVGSASIDVAVTMTNNRGFVQFGHTLDYVIVVTAAGPSNAHNVSVTDLLPSQLDAANAHWICVPAVGASCAASGSGDLVGQSADIPSGGSVTFELSATVLNDQAVNNDTITNTVSVSVDGDIAPGNNTMTVVTEAVIFRNAFEAGGDGSH